MKSIVAFVLLVLAYSIGDASFSYYVWRPLASGRTWTSTAAMMATYLVPSLVAAVVIGALAKLVWPRREIRIVGALAACIGLLNLLRVVGLFRMDIETILINLLAAIVVFAVVIGVYLALTRRPDRIPVEAG
jgi:hypothetical protein